MAAKVRVVRRQPPSTEDVEEFVKNFQDMMSKGDFDTHLDIIWEAVDNRIREYFQDEGGSDPEQQENVSKIRRLRRGPVNLTIGRYYSVLGEAYAGVTVEFLGMTEETDGEIPKARVRIHQMVGGATRGRIVIGNTYKIPVAALEYLSEG